MIDDDNNIIFTTKKNQQYDWDCGITCVAMILETLGCQPLSHKLLERQLLFLGRVAQAESENVLRQAFSKTIP